MTFFTGKKHKICADRKLVEHDFWQSFDGTTAKVDAFHDEWKLYKVQTALWSI